MIVAPARSIPSLRSLKRVSRSEPFVYNFRIAMQQKSKTQKGKVLYMLRIYDLYGLTVEKIDIVEGRPTRQPPQSPQRPAFGLSFYSHQRPVAHCLQVE